jgi:hypothetical protein
MTLGESDLSDDKRPVKSACPRLDGPAYSFLDAVVFCVKAIEARLSNYSARP